MSTFISPCVGPWSRSSRNTKSILISCLSAKGGRGLMVSLEESWEIQTVWMSWITPPLKSVSFVSKKWNKESHCAFVHSSLEPRFQGLALAQNPVAPFLPLQQCPAGHAETSNSCFTKHQKTAQLKLLPHHVRKLSHLINKLKYSVWL